MFDPADHLPFLFFHYLLTRGERHPADEWEVRIRCRRTIYKNHIYPRIQINEAGEMTATQKEPDK